MSRVIATDLIPTIYAELVRLAPDINKKLVEFIIQVKPEESYGDESQYVMTLSIILNSMIYQIMEFTEGGNCQYENVEFYNCKGARKIVNFPGCDLEPRELTEIQIDSIVEILALVGKCPGGLKLNNHILIESDNLLLTGSEVKANVYGSFLEDISKSKELDGMILGYGHVLQLTNIYRECVHDLFYNGKYHNHFLETHSKEEKASNFAVMVTGSKWTSKGIHIFKGSTTNLVGIITAKLDSMLVKYPYISYEEDKLEELIKICDEKREYKDEILFDVLMGYTMTKMSKWREGLDISLDQKEISQINLFMDILYVKSTVEGKSLNITNHSELKKKFEEFSLECPEAASWCDRFNNRIDDKYLHVPFTQTQNMNFCFREVYTHYFEKYLFLLSKIEEGSMSTETLINNTLWGYHLKLLMLEEHLESYDNPVEDMIHGSLMDTLIAQKVLNDKRPGQKAINQTSKEELDLSSLKEELSLLKA